MAERFFILWRGALRSALGRLGASPVVRERALASAVFACIFAFATLSMDYLVTGGPDWNPGGGESLSAPIVERVAATSLRIASMEPAPTLPVVIAIETADFGGPVGELLGGPDMEWAPVNYETEGASSGEIYGPSDAGKELEIAYPTEAAFTLGKTKPPATHS